MSQPSQEGITAKKAENFDEWYTQVILKAEIADYTPVSGCLAYRPSGYAIWENIQREADAHFKRIGIQNTYFPMFIPERLLKKEAEHVEGFSPEVAWVTKAGNTELEERLAVRPTSETIMYEVTGKWIRSWRDLPLRLNQWNNVVRWEFRHPTPLLRTREFLWNEGHTMFATREEADAERDQILGIYRHVTEDFLALPGYTGKKTESEKFAGAVASYSVEHLLPDGRAIQGPDFHSDGQRFAKAFDLTYLDQEGATQFVWQNTWAITTREIGVMLAVHGDDKGAIVPPMVSMIQVVVVPIFNDENKESVLREATRVYEALVKDGVRTKLDDRSHLTPGRKYNEWEIRGVPLRLEIGPRDVQSAQVVLARRDLGTKRPVKSAEGYLSVEVTQELQAIQKALYDRAKDFLHRNTHVTSSYDEMKRLLKERGGIVQAPWCESKECEAKIKEETGAKILNVPLDQKNSQMKCVVDGSPAHLVANIARSY